MRATANNPELAQVRGINTERVIAWTWVLGGAIAAAGGVMYALASQLRPEMGFWLLLPMFAAVIMGGVGNPIGALGGAIIIGVDQQVSASFLTPAYGPAVAFGVVGVVRVLRPQGLFGTAGGGMYALASQLRPEMGFWLLLPMFAAVIMGGVGNPIGALVGAIIIGVAQQVSASFLNPAYGPAVAFVLMVVVLVLRPQGLFGQAGE